MDLTTLVRYLKRHISDDVFGLLVANGVPLTGPTGLRRWVAERDVEAFLRLYFPAEFSLTLPPIHQAFITDIEGIRERALTGTSGIKLARAVPRGHAKTSYFARMLPLWAFLFGWSPLTVMLANNATAAERLLRNIRECVETNSAIAEDFPGIRGETWQADHLEASNGCAIRAFGRGSGAIRGVSKPGERPSLIIADDLDDDQLVRSAIELEAAIEWWTKAVMALGDNATFRTSFVVTGTVIRKTSLMKHILDSQDFQAIIERGVTRFADNQALWDEWAAWFTEQAKQGKAPTDPASDEFYQAHRDDMLAGSELLWEREGGYWHLMVYRLSRGQAAFDSEIQNAPGASSQLLGTVPLIPLPTDQKGYQLLASLDPTIKGGIKNDKAAWVELLFHRQRKELIAVFSNAEQRPAAQTVDYVLSRMRLSTKPGAKRYDGLWCEDNSAGSLIADTIEERSRNEGLFYSINRIHNSSAKEDRISLLGEYAARGQFFVAKGIDQEFVAEWEGFGSYRWDDALDSAATVLIALKDAGLLDLISAPY